MPPPEELVVTYAMNLRKDKKEPVYDEANKPDHVYGTIKKYIGAITGTCVEFHAVPTTKNEDMRVKMHQWEDMDEVFAAKAFDMAEDLPRMFDAVHKMTGWHKGKQLKVGVARPGPRDQANFGVGGPASRIPVR